LFLVDFTQKHPGGTFKKQPLPSRLGHTRIPNHGYWNGTQLGHDRAFTAIIGDFAGSEQGFNQWKQQQLG
jgi:hypothetical protein